MVHQSLGLILSIQNTKVSIDSIVGSLKSHTLFKQLNKLIFVSKLLVESHYFL